MAWFVPKRRIRMHVFTPAWANGGDPRRDDCWRCEQPMQATCHIEPRLQGRSYAMLERRPADFTVRASGDD